MPCWSTALWRVPPSLRSGVNPLRPLRDVCARGLLVPAVTAGVVQRAFKFRLYPTSKQHDALRLMCAAHAEFYNAGLQGTRRRLGDAAQVDQRVLPDGAARGDPCPPSGPGGGSFTSQQQTLRRLDKAFGAFFRRVKAREALGHPRFRDAARFDRVNFRHGDGIKLIPATKGHDMMGVGARTGPPGPEPAGERHPRAGVRET
jgi:hypothetical protein